MTLRFASVPRACFVLSMFLCALSALNAAAQTPQTRITQPIIQSQRVTLSGQVHPLAKAQYDQGAIDDSAPASRIMMMLSRTDAQQAALDKLVDEQHTPGSANYRRWLTPEEFGARFGASDADVQKITAWLVSQGFTVENVAPSKTLIEFSGTAGQVKSAFQTELHSYTVATGTYTANNADPQIPIALAPVVKGFVSLNNFPRHSYSHSRPAVRNANGTVRPLWTGTDSNGTFYAISPGDFATIYNAMPLLYSTINGAGQTIGIIGQSNINLADVTNFRSLFGLPASTPTVVVYGTDPGLVSGDEGESVMDVEWAGATAPGATIKLVTAKTTGASSGVDLAAQYLVNNDLADILSESYGACEHDLGTYNNSFYKGLWQQAASQGITVVVSTGDNGSAGCEDQTTATVSENSSGGVAVNGLASTPYNVAVGGTDFNDASSLSSYWASNYYDSATGEKHISAIGYIPEMTWNDSCAYSATSTSLTSCAGVTSTSSSTYGTLQLWAGSGGPSNCAVLSSGSCTSGYSKPSWQTGTGVPNDGVRDLPDVSLFAATGESGSSSFYVACQSDASGSCVLNSNNQIPFIGVSGTSASAPNFAAIVALAGQQVGNQRLGNVNYLLYKIAAQSGASCTSSGTPSSSCVFYDTQVGNISVPCNPGSPDCSVSSGTAKGVLVANGAPAYMTTAGYDTATGLGSVNVTNLVAAIAGLAVPTISAPSAAPSSVNVGGSTTLSVTVTGNSNLGAPAGTIKFYDSGALIGTATKSTLNSTAISGTLSFTPSTAGTHSITATYIADGSYTSYVGATSAVLAFTVTALPTPAISIPTATPSTFTAGESTTLTVAVTGDSTTGTPTGSIQFYDSSTLIGTATTSTPGSNVLQGTFTYTPSTAGTHSVTAHYLGDSNFGAITSGAVTVTANAAFTQSLASSAISIGSSGGSGTNVITFTPASTGVPTSTTVSISCSSNSTAASCSASPTSVTMGSGAVTANIAYTVPARTAFATPSERGLPWKLGGGLLFAGVIVCAVPAVRRRGQLALMILLISGVAIAASCGGGGSTSTTTPTSQTYTFTVTATTTVNTVMTTQTSTFTVTN